MKPSSDAGSDEVAFLCLGVMGYPMAGHLLRAGHRVRVYNRNASRADAWLTEHSDAAAGRASSAESPAKAAEGAAAVFVCTGNDADLRQVVLGEEGALVGMRPGTCLIDHTTVSAPLAREIGQAARDKGVDFLDAPISGGQVGAETGKLTVMVGGEEEVYERATHWLDCYAKKHLWMGHAGSGQLTKAVNQICIAGLVQALSEGLHFAQRVGLDAGRVVEVISKGAAQSWQMDNRAQTMLEDRYDFGFAVDWMRKDLAIALEEGRRSGASLQITALVDELYAEVQRRGGGRLDTSSLMSLLE
jgi:3-hydroxyisobutyrate dehydrogenase-like beta-hydroxyacid dehydrogenase